MSSIVIELTAIYAALVATGVLVWTIYRDVKDRGHIRLECGFRDIVTPWVGTEEHVLAFRMTNVGSRPVMVTNVGGRTSKTRGFIVNDDQIPKMLAAGEFPVTFMREFENLKNGATELAAYDSVGRVYKVNRKDIREINALAKELIASGVTKSVTRDIDKNSSD